MISSAAVAGPLGRSTARRQLSKTMTDNIEKQLNELQLRHRLHQQMLDDHHERKWRRREDHRNGIHKMKFPAGTLK